MMIDVTKTVRELAVENPSATRVFEKLRIDYCCGGHLSLEEACRKAGVEVGQVSELLEKTKNEAIETNIAAEDFTKMSLAALADYIVRKHHTFTREESERITALLEKVCSVHGKNHEELFEIQKIFGMLRLEIENHLLKEERMLFPYIALMESSLAFGMPVPPAPFGSTSNPVAVMVREHDTAGEHLREIRNLSSDFAAPADACITYKTLYAALEGFERDLHRHIHLENNILFPKAIEMEKSGLPADSSRMDEVKCGLPVLSAEHHA
ncbi:MAG TPA: iron-sulfur cluster repair di-iron protein [Pyrinomonadaceae bacterium]|nr:iron-sulfur cluster repair di-iron protein [Pyrinomonadaceae bacterium]